MIWAASCMCFFWFLRSGEIVVPSSFHYDPNLHLSYGDVCLNDTTSPKFLAVHIKAPKTDPFRQGISIYLGKSGVDVCPVSAILAYMLSRVNQPGAFFAYASGQPLTRKLFVSSMRAALRSQGVYASTYCGHSFRIGAATAAAKNGVPDSLIKTMGRWESSAYTRYIRTPRQTLCMVAQSLVSRCP